MRPGAAHRTQQCRGCKNSTHRESEMTPAAQVLGEGKRGWLCQWCATAEIERRAKRDANWPYTQG